MRGGWFGRYKGSDQQIDQAEAHKLSEVLSTLSFVLSGDTQSDAGHDDGKGGFSPIVQSILLHEDVVDRLLSIFDQSLDDEDLGDNEKEVTELQTMLVDCVDFISKCTMDNFEMQTKVGAHFYYFFYIFFSY